MNGHIAQIQNHLTRHCYSPRNSRKLLPQKTYDNFTRIPFTIFKNFSFSISLVRNSQTQEEEICSLIKQEASLNHFHLFRSDKPLFAVFLYFLQSVRCSLRVLTKDSWILQYFTIFSITVLKKYHYFYTL